MTNLKKMTRKELKQYILENRNNTEIVDAAIEESLFRPGSTTVPENIPLEEQEYILQNAFKQAQ